MWKLETLSCENISKNQENDKKKDSQRQQQFTKFLIASQPLGVTTATEIAAETEVKWER